MKPDMGGGGDTVLTALLMTAAWVVEMEDKVTVLWQWTEKNSINQSSLLRGQNKSYKFKVKKGKTLFSLLLWIILCKEFDKLDILPLLVFSKIRQLYGKGTLSDQHFVQKYTLLVQLQYLPGFEPNDLADITLIVNWVSSWDTAFNWWWCRASNRLFNRHYKIKIIPSSVSTANSFDYRAAIVQRRTLQRTRSLFSQQRWVYLRTCWLRWALNALCKNTAKAQFVNVSFPSSLKNFTLLYKMYNFSNVQRIYIHWAWILVHRQCSTRKELGWTVHKWTKGTVVTPLQFH